MKDLAICLHVPLCNERCAFCDRLRVPATISMVERYTDALLAEIDAGADDMAESVVRAVRFAGCVPLMLAGHNIARVAHRLRQRFTFADDVELTVDTVSGKLDEHNLRLFKTIGVNRIGFFLPTSNTVEHFRFRCPGDIGQTHEHNSMRRAFGLDAWNVRLLYGLPGQTEALWQHTLDDVCAMRPSCITLEQAWLVDCAGFDEECAQTPPSHEEAFRLYRQVCDVLGGEGYRRCAGGGFALPGKAPKFDELLLNGSDVLGLGAGAASFVEGVAYRNTSDVSRYVERSDDFEEIVRDPVALNEDAMRKKFVRDHLMTPEGLSSATYERAFDEPMGDDLRAVLDELIRIECVVLDYEQEHALFRLTDRGAFEADGVAALLDCV